MNTFKSFTPLEKMSTYTNFRHNSVSMTAIVSVYTSDGFIIGADGLRRGTDGAIVSKTVQKVFHFENADIRLAYAWSGTTQIYDSRNQCVFDFAAVTEKGLQVAVFTGGPDFASFIGTFQKILYFTTYNAGFVKNGRIVGLNRNERIAQVLIVGYFNGESCLAEIDVCHQNLSLLEPKLVKLQVPMNVNRNIFSGCESAFGAFSERYPMSTDEALLFVREYIQACSDSAEPDCGNIGGHIHIGKITPEAFSWVEPPVPN